LAVKILSSKGWRIDDIPGNVDNIIGYRLTSLKQKREMPACPATWRELI
jgi:hypothetical protein